MKNIVYFLIVAGCIAVAFHVGYRNGNRNGRANVWNEAHQAADAYYYRQAELDKRTRRIIAANEHRKGFEECQEQF